MRRKQNATRVIRPGAPPVQILGAPFRFRTFHAPNPKGWQLCGSWAARTIDTEIVVTLAAVPGARHREPASVLVELA
jgi:hypothetical protein